MKDSIISAFGAQFYRAWRSYVFNEEREEKHAYSIPIIAVLWCQIFVLAVVLIFGYSFLIRRSQALSKKKDKFKPKDFAQIHQTLNIPLLRDMMKDYQKRQSNFDMVSIIKTFYLL